ncbi:MAG TPA: DUF2617 family protein [Bacteroidia bacterium]|nr:DUF2617 family protein [Bacteroidia bacterium]
MINLEYVDQSPSELNLNIFYKKFNKTKLMVINKEIIKLDDFDIEIAIIGASHYIEVKKNNELLFAEVFACIALEDSNLTLNPSEISYEDKLTFNDDYDGINYKFQYLELDMEKEISQFEIERFNHENILEYDFSKNHLEPAVTSLILGINTKNIILESLHVYPNHNKAIITKSSINLL